MNWLFCLLLILCYDIQADPPAKLELPWLTDPLLIPSPYTVGVGHQTYRPYVYWIKKTGEYDADWQTHSSRHQEVLALKPIIKWGVFPRGELDIIPEFFYKNSEGPHSWRLGDLGLGISVQLHEEDKFLNLSWPDVKLRFDCVLPLGQYDELNPRKYGTDISGKGSWYPGATLAMGKLFHFTDIHWLSMFFSFTYAFGTSASVHGLSIYGGTQKTQGTIYPGNVWIVNLGWEATLTRHVALACDLESTHYDKARFSGKKGQRAPKRPSSELYKVAPAIEYNLSANWGFIMGPSFTFAGRNAPEEIAWIISMTLRN